MRKYFILTCVGLVLSILACVFITLYVKDLKIALTCELPLAIAIIFTVYNYTKYDMLKIVGAPCDIGDIVYYVSEEGVVLSTRCESLIVTKNGVMIAYETLDGINASPVGYEVFLHREEAELMLEWLKDNPPDYDAK